MSRLPGVAFEGYRRISTFYLYPILYPEFLEPRRLTGRDKRPASWSRSPIRHFHATLVDSDTCNRIRFCHFRETSGKLLRVEAALCKRYKIIYKPLAFRLQWPAFPRPGGAAALKGRHVHQDRPCLEEWSGRAKKAIRTSWARTISFRVADSGNA